MSLTKNDLKIVEDVEAILKNEYKHHHSHETLANRFHISDRKLRTIFKQVNDKTINDYLTDVRIEKAKELLSNTDDQIKKIASDVGYDTRNLEKQFKSITGMTPLEWRNRSEESGIAG